MGAFLRITAHFSITYFIAALSVLAMLVSRSALAVEASAGAGVGNAASALAQGQRVGEKLTQRGIDWMRISKVCQDMEDKAETKKSVSDGKFQKVVRGYSDSCWSLEELASAQDNQIQTTEGFERHGVEGYQKFMKETFMDVGGNQKDSLHKAGENFQAAGGYEGAMKNTVGAAATDTASALEKWEKNYGNVMEEQRSYMSSVPRRDLQHTADFFGALATFTGKVYDLTKQRQEFFRSEQQHFAAKEQQFHTSADQMAKAEQAVKTESLNNKTSTVKAPPANESGIPYNATGGSRMGGGMSGAEMVAMGNAGLGALTNLTNLLNSDGAKGGGNGRGAGGGPSVPSSFNLGADDDTTKGVSLPKGKPELGVLDSDTSKSKKSVRSRNEYEVLSTSGVSDRSFSAETRSGAGGAKLNSGSASRMPSSVRDASGQKELKGAGTSGKNPGTDPSPAAPASNSDDLALADIGGGGLGKPMGLEGSDTDSAVKDMMESMQKMMSDTGTALSEDEEKKLVMGGGGGDAFVPEPGAAIEEGKRPPMMARAAENKDVDSKPLFGRVHETINRHASKGLVLYGIGKNKF